MIKDKNGELTLPEVGDHHIGIFILEPHTLKDLRKDINLANIYITIDRLCICRYCLTPRELYFDISGQFLRAFVGRKWANCFTCGSEPQDGHTLEQNKPWNDLVMKIQASQGQIEPSSVKGFTRHIDDKPMVKVDN